MPKYDQVAEQLKHRIQQGDYALRGFPAERQLALECGVAHMTIRRAVQQLIDEGLIVRGSNGRIETKNSDENGTANLRIALLVPGFQSPNLERWKNSLLMAAEAVGATVRPVIYRHWDDPIFGTALDGFDGVFLLPLCEPMSPVVVQALKQAKPPVAVLDDDLSQYGFPSVRSSSPVFVQRLLDHLEAQGCHRIACLNVQPHSEYGVTAQRIEQWQVWMAMRHFDGELIDEPVETFGDPFVQAHRVVAELLVKNNFDYDALLATTAPGAIGAMRAMLDAGVRPGIDVAVCTIDGEGLAAHMNPSLTAVEPADVIPYIRICLQWMVRGGAWKGPLLLQPTEPMLAVRESTRSPRFSTVESTQELQLLQSGNQRLVQENGNAPSLR